MRPKEKMGEAPAQIQFCLQRSHQILHAKVIKSKQATLEPNRLLRIATREQQKE